ncbi:MAG: hypothetical protein HETSPECPRED_006104 [Heterodermia speciosa]|uniref:Uncharacterized protein n=1 Tax=Heterodermia speciosa TaxID=116794 RepID=A0A8H3HX89_9LECA|nr:MAG: hypothetical protein HETSPECPRED_006104 [Heterodermia speciosa]
MRSSFVVIVLTASIPTLLPFTAALPSFRTLLPRKKTAEVDVTSDWSDPARPGWLHCFTSGSWLPTQLITYPVAQVCAASQSVEGISTVNSAANTGSINSIQKSSSSFSFTSLNDGSDGTAPHQYISVIVACPPQGLGDGGCAGSIAQMYPKFDTVLQSPKHATTEDCTYSMDKVLNGCPKGDYNDTRGGWWEFADDRTTFGMDVQRTDDYIEGP